MKHGSTTACHDKTTVQTIDENKLNCSKEDKNCSVSRKGDFVDCFLKFTGCGVHRLSTKSKNGFRYYGELLENWTTLFKAKYSHLAKKIMLLHHDNAPVYSFSITVAKLHELPLELLSHATYPSDFPVSEIEETARWKRFTSNTDFIAETNAHLTYS